MKNVQKKIEEYLIDGKVRHLSKEKDINIKLGEPYKNKTCKDCVDLIYPVND